MDELLKQHDDHCILYIYDILMLTDILEDHIKHSNLVIGTCITSGINLSTKQAIIGVQKIDF